MRRSWRLRRWASTASSLPIVVGVAGWPWVCASSGTSVQVARHRRRPASTSAVGPRQPHLLDGALDHEGVGEVVDVLARAAEVDQLGEALVLVGRRDRGQALLEEVLDGLDVVHGDPLDVAELGDLVGAEVVDDLLAARDSRRR